MALLVAILRVIVTRPEREAMEWVEQLMAHAIHAAALPLITVAACTDPASQAALDLARSKWTHYRAAMFVSSNAVRYFFEQNKPLTLDIKQVLAINTRAWAPGPATAEALAEAGIPHHHIDAPAPSSAQFDSEALWQQVAHQVRPGDHILIVRGRTAGAPPTAQGAGRDWLACQIQKAGAHVEYTVAYERSAPHLTQAQMAMARTAAHDGSCWLFSSSEAIGHLASALPGQSWAHARALATHPRIAETARQAGFGRVLECRPALADVVSSIESAA